MKAVLVLCEGRHDIVFVQRSLGAVAGCRWVDKAMKDLPSPFGAIPGKSSSPKGLIAQRAERDPGELTFWSAKYPRLPRFETAVSDEEAGIIFFLVNMNGKDQFGAVIDLLEQVDISMEVAGVGTVVDAVTEYAAAFLFDADADGMVATLRTFRKRYHRYFGDLSEAGHAKWVPTATCPVGVFVFHRTAEDETGTLEDHLAPMVAAAWPDWYASARGFIDDHWRPDDEVSRSEARRLKAVITSAGQFKRPGSSLEDVLSRYGLPEEQFQASQMSRTLVGFLQGVPWRDNSSPADAT